MDIMHSTRLALSALVMLIAAQALAADLPAVGTRTIGNQPAVGTRTIGNQHFLVDRNGATVGKLRELSPGRWDIEDKRGMTVGTVQGAPGVPPVVLGPVGR